MVNVFFVYLRSILLSLRSRGLILLKRSAALLIFINILISFVNIKSITARFDKMFKHIKNLTAFAARFLTCA